MCLCYMLSDHVSLNMEPFGYTEWSACLSFNVMVSNCYAKWQATVIVLSNNATATYLHMNTALWLLCKCQKRFPFKRWPVKPLAFQWDHCEARWKICKANSVAGGEHLGPPQNQLYFIFKRSWESEDWAGNVLPMYSTSQKFGHNYLFKGFSLFVVKT